MWPFAGLFESSDHRSKRPLPGKWPDDVSDTSTSMSDLSVLENGLDNHAWLGVTRTKISSYSLSVLRAVQFVWNLVMVWIGLKTCVACGTLHTSLAATIEQLRIVRDGCGDLESANGILKAEWTKDKALVKSLYDKLMGTANYAESLEKEWIHMERLLERQEPHIIAFRQELDRLKAEILRLKEENSDSQGEETTDNDRRQLRRLEKSHVIMQRRLLLANARNEDLIRQNNELARRVQLAKLEQKAEEELAKAKEDIEWYEGKQIQQQEKIFELGRLLGFSKAANRDMREAHRIEMERLKDQFSAQLESLNEAYDRDIAEMDETAVTFYQNKLQEWNEREEWLLGNVKRQADLDAEDRVHETVMARQEAHMKMLGAETLEKERNWREQMNELKQKNDSLKSQLAELRDFMNEQVEEGVAKRLVIERALDRSELVKALEGRIVDLQAQFDQEREDHREQMKAAVAQGWQLSSDAKAQELLEEIDQMDEALQQAEDERDELFNELKECRQSAEDSVNEAKERKEEVEELKMELAKLSKAHESLRATHDELRIAHTSVVNAQEAAMEANAKHQSDLQMARNQVDTLVEQLEELEEDLQSLRIARKEADKMHKFLLDAERQKNHDLVTATNTARNSSYQLSPIREEDGEEEGSEEDGSVSPQPSFQTPPARVPVASRSSSVGNRKSMSPVSNPTMVASQFTEDVGSDAHQSDGRAPLEPAEERANRVPYMSPLAITPPRDASRTERRRYSNSFSPSPSWSVEV